jgi:iron complex outermembrane receptor protein
MQSPIARAATRGSAPFSRRHFRFVSCSVALIATSSALAQESLPDIDVGQGAPGQSTPATDSAPRSRGARISEKPFSKAIPDNIPAVVQTITAKQITEQVNASNAVETLRYLPSIEIVEKFPGDNFQDIQGRTTGPFQPMHNLVYVDGILLSALLGGSSFTPRFQMVMPEEIARIDVVYGPYSALYPGNSIGGVVAFTTKAPDKFQLHAKLQGLLAPYDQYDTHQTNPGYTGSLSIGDRIDGFSWRAGYDRLLTNAQPIFFSSAVAPRAAVGTPVSGGFFDRDRQGLPRGVFGAGPIQTTEQNTGKLKLAYDFGPYARASYTLGLLHLADHFTAQSYLRNAAAAPVFNTPNNVIGFNGLDYPLFGLNPGSVEYLHLMQGAEIKTETGGAFDLDIAGSSYNILRDVGVTAQRFGVTTLGQARELSGTGWNTADLRAIFRPQQGILENHEISVGGHFDQYELKQYLQNTPSWLSSWSYEQASRSVGKTRTFGLYIQDVWSFLPDWKLTLGGRQEFWLAFEGANENKIGTTRNYDDRAASAFTPKASLAYQATHDFLLRGSYGNARRFPGVNELFQRLTSPTGVLLNNPDLAPEQVDSFELSAEYDIGKHAARLAFFHEDRWDAITFQTDTTVVPNVSSSQNVEKMRFNGVEGAIRSKDVPFDGFDIDASATYIDTQIVANSKNPASVNKDVPLMPRWRAKIIGTYHATDNLTLSVGLRYKSSSYFQLDNFDVNHETWGGASRNLILDARATYEFAPHWTAVVGVNNIGRYKHWLYSPYPQRTFFAELRYDFD